MKRTLRWSTIAVASLAGLVAAADPPPVSEKQPVPAPVNEERLQALEKRVKELTETPKTGRGLLELAASGIQVAGFVDATYSWNLDEPDHRKGANRYRLVDPDHNSFGIPYASLAMFRDVSRVNELDAGFRVELASGRLVEEALSEDGFLDSVPLDLPQAYVDLQLPTPWDLPIVVRVGRQYSFLGRETLNLAENGFVSLSPLATFGPKTLTGASLGIDLGGGLSYTQWVGNGWDQVIDRNDAKSFGGQLVYRYGDRFDLSLGWLAGAEREDSEGDLRWAAQLDLGWAPWDGCQIRTALQVGQEEGGALDGGRAQWAGLSALIRQGFFPVAGGEWHRLTMGVRGSYFRDQGGARTGEDQALGEITASLEVRVIKHAALRVEYRRDFSSVEAFDGRDSQHTLAAEVRFAF